MSNHQRSVPLFLLGLTGLLVSGLSGALEQIPSLQFLCSTACGETAEIVFLRVPIWFWGSVFWAAVAIFAFLRRSVLQHLASPALGVEVALVWIMFRMNAPCVFCIANAVLVLILFGFSFRKELFWRQAAIALALLILSVFWIPRENNLFADSAGPLLSDESAVVAKIGGETITDQRLEVQLGPKIQDLKKEIYRMKKEKLDQIIIESLIVQEAKSKGITIEQLLEEAAPASLFVVTEQEIDQYIQDNQGRIKEWQGNMPDLRARIKTFLEQQKRIQKVNDYARSLDEKYGVQVLLPEPVTPKVEVSTKGAQAQGPKEAAVTIIEFSDYECPACRSTHQTVKKLKDEYGDRVRWVFRDYPLKRHKQARKAAEAAHCASEQGKYWEYQDLAFRRDKLDPESLVKYAAELGLAADQFSKCLSQGKYATVVEEGAHAAAAAGIDRTPSFLINGTLLTGGLSFDAFKARIDEELKKAELSRQAGMKQ